MGMVSALDDAVGSVVSELKRQDMWDNTLLIFSTDNGGNIGEQGNNYPLRGGKFSFWEGGNRGVGFVHSESTSLLPKSVRGATYNGLMHVADWYATLCEAVGATLPKSSIDSLSQWHALRTPGASSPRDEIVHDAKINKHGKLWQGKLRTGKWNLYLGFPGKPNEWMHPNGTSDKGPQNCSKAACLFDLSVDPNEHQDVAKANADLVTNFTARLKEAGACPDSFCGLDNYKGKNSLCDAFNIYGCYGPWASRPGAEVASMVV